MYIDYIILGVISVAVVVWAYTRLPGDDDDSDGGQVVSAPSGTDDPSPVSAGPTEPSGATPSSSGPAGNGPSGDGASGGGTSPGRSPDTRQPDVEPAEPASV